MAVCPTCGQQVARADEVTWLLTVLKTAVPHREVYRGQDGHWYVTYGAGRVSPQAVEELKRCGEIVSVYSNCPNDAYHVGRTLDYERTIEARKKHGKGAPLVYVAQNQSCHGTPDPMRNDA
jgi:hypothetical protein